MNAPTWVPHHRETWPFRFAKLKADQVMRVWKDHARDDRGCPIMVEHVAPVGTVVKIVMVSRLGDVGITDDLTVETGYRARVLLEDLEEVREPEAHRLSTTRAGAALALVASAICLALPARASDLTVPSGMMLCPTAAAAADPKHAGCWFSHGGQRIDHINPAVTWSQLIVWTSDGSERAIVYGLKADTDKLQVPR